MSLKLGHRHKSITWKSYEWLKTFKSFNFRIIVLYMQLSLPLFTKWMSAFYLWSNDFKNIYTFCLLFKIYHLDLFAWIEWPAPRVLRCCLWGWHPVIETLHQRSAGFHGDSNSACSTFHANASRNSSVYLVINEYNSSFFT